jgi:hypothetical protein
MLNNTAWCLSLLLGQASALLGLMITLGWVLAFALVIPPRGMPWGVGPRLLLPITPPLVGFAVGLSGLFLARWSHEPVARFPIAGMLLNAFALVLTMLVHLV